MTKICTCKHACHRVFVHNLFWLNTSIWGYDCCHCNGDARAELRDTLRVAIFSVHRPFPTCLLFFSLFFPFWSLSLSLFHKKLTEEAQRPTPFLPKKNKGREFYSLTISGTTAGVPVKGSKEDDKLGSGSYFLFSFTSN